MAIIQTIRTRFGSIAVILIGLSLALYIVSLALDDNTSLFAGSKDVVGVIDGNKIKIQEYQQVENQLVENYKLQSQSPNIDDNTMNALREQAWNQMVSDYLNNSEYSKLGITVSDQEIQDMFYGTDALPEIKQAFTNPQTGVFDPVAVKNYVENLDQTGQGEKPGERRQRWEAYQKGKTEERLQTKYQNLVSKSIYVPKWQAEMDYIEKNAHAEVKFVSIPYNTIVDSTIKVTDAELQNYLNRNKEKYKQEESRQLDFVSFTVKPSSVDTAAVRDDINNIYSQLIANPQDTDVLKLNSENGRLDEFYYKADKLASAAVKDTLFKLAPGTIYGPYFEDGSYKIAKLMDRKVVADSVKARHILVKVENPSDSTAAKQKADSLLNLLNQGAIFDSLAVKFSDDQGTKDNGGDLGLVAQAQTVPEFNKFLFFESTAGEMKVVRTQFGYHIIKIEEKKNEAEAVQVNFIVRPLTASTETNKNIYDLASKFAGAAISADSFKQVAASQQLSTQSAPSIQKNAYQLTGVSSAREVVKWAFNAKKGEVSPVITCDDGNTYVVACVTSIKEEGTMDIEDIRQQLETAVRKEKKGKMIAAKFPGAMGINATLESMAESVNQQLKTASNVTFANAYTQNLGYEPKVVGEIFGLDSNQVSGPLIGEQAVYVVQVTSLTPAPEIADYNQYKQQVAGAMQQRLQYGIPEALKKSIKVTDDRYRFF